jgi:hypothetical protein
MNTSIQQLVDYPYTVIRRGRHADEFLAFDVRTGNEGRARKNYEEAACDIYDLIIRSKKRNNVQCDQDLAFIKIEAA